MNKLEQLREYKAKISMGGGKDKIDAQHAKGKMTARERLDILFDEGSFVEIDTFVTNRSNNFDMPQKKFHAGWRNLPKGKDPGYNHHQHKSIGECKQSLLF